MLRSMLSVGSHWNLCSLWSLCTLGGLCIVGCAPEPQEPQTAAPAAAPATAPAAPAAPPAEPEVARAGVGKRGQSLRDEQGVGRMIAQPAITLFAVEQRAVFDIQIPSALNLYKASNGDFPKSHEEFMTQIIKANNIRLPELPAGRVYRFHPDEGLLYVHPANE
jgi:hypothetical protein